MPMTQQGRLTLVTRRYVQVCDEQFEFHRGTIQGGGSSSCVGDIVSFSSEPDGAILVVASEPRGNLLERSDGRRRKSLASNIDLLLVAAAPKPLFNALAIDRVLAAAEQQNIRWCLLCNKSDQTEQLAETNALLDAYRRIGDVLVCSAVSGEGFEALQNVLSSEPLKHAVLTGVSGVGKSTILNRLVPDIGARTQTVSERTGQGRQTTSHAQAHLFPRESAPPLLLTDLPGVQNFGIRHLSEQEIRAAFREFLPYAQQCRFADCSHTTEPDCSLRPAVEQGRIPELRYKSYREMVEDVRSFDPYA